MAARCQPSRTYCALRRRTTASAAINGILTDGVISGIEVLDAGLTVGPLVPALSTGGRVLAAVLLLLLATLYGLSRRAATRQL